MTEYWIHAFPYPKRVAELAVQAEEWGLTGLLLADSEILVGDPYVELALAARATSTLRLGPGVTNPVTRHPAVTAAALATLQVESGGRAVAVVGRGDSAVLQIGLQPATTAQLRKAVTDLRAYLEDGGSPAEVGRPGTLPWYQSYAPAHLPVSVAATGPRTIDLAARHADGVDLTVGADPDRLGRAVELARRAAADAGTRPQIGAWVNLAVGPDVAAARELVRGSAAIFAHFVSEGPLDALSSADRAVVEPLRRDYVERDHGLTSAGHAGRLPDEFLDRFTVVGTPDVVIERLRHLASLGIDRFIVVPGSRDADPDLMARSNRLFAREVLPHLT